MSGGQLRRNGQRPLYEVVREEERRRESDQRRPRRESQPAGRHCWVQAADGSAKRWPGVVVSWRRDPDGWRGRVVYVVPTEGGDPVVVDEWVEARVLSPAPDHRG